MLTENAIPERWTERVGDEPWVRSFAATSSDDVTCEMTIDEVALSFYFRATRRDGGVDETTWEGLQSVAFDETGAVRAAFGGDLGVGTFEAMLDPLFQTRSVHLRG